MLTFQKRPQKFSANEYADLEVMFEIEKTKSKQDIPILEINVADHQIKMRKDSENIEIQESLNDNNRDFEVVNDSIIQEKGCVIDQQEV